LNEFGLSEAEKSRRGLPNEYITWHIRKTPGLHERNQTPFELRTLFKLLIEAPVPVVLITTARGYDALDKALESEKRLGDGRVIFLGEIGYLESLRAVLSSSFHYQLFGGGISVAAHYSSVPVLEVQFSPGSLPKPKGVNLFPWQSPFQRFLLVKTREEGIKRFMESLHE
jgi:hypothetical protein